jgi:hypothetical protein
MMPGTSDLVSTDILRMQSINANSVISDLFSSSLEVRMTLRLRNLLTDYSIQLSFFTNDR